MWMADVIEFFNKNQFSTLAWECEKVVSENDLTVLNCGLVESEWVKERMSPIFNTETVDPYYWWRKLESEVITYMPMS